MADKNALNWVSISKTLFDHYGVKPDKLILKRKKENKDDTNKAYYDLYNRTINLNLTEADDTKDILISILHEIHHMIDEKNLGHDTYDIMYQNEMGTNGYKKNKFEINAEKFGVMEVNKWIHLIQKK